MFTFKENVNNRFLEENKKYQYKFTYASNQVLIILSCFLPEKKLLGIPIVDIYARFNVVLNYDILLGNLETFGRKQKHNF